MAEWFDVKANQPHLTVANQREPVSQLTTTLSQRTYFGSRQLNTGFKRFHSLIFKTGTPVTGNDSPGFIHAVPSLSWHPDQE
jgi:hypothetical protein